MEILVAENLFQDKTLLTQDHLRALTDALDSGAFVQVRRMLNHLPAPTIAHKNSRSVVENGGER